MTSLLYSFLLYVGTILLIILFGELVWFMGVQHKMLVVALAAAENVAVEHKGTLFCVVVVIAIFFCHHTIFREVIIKEKKKEYLQNLYAVHKKNMLDTALILMILRNVPETAEALPAIQKHVDYIQIKVETLRAIDKATKNLGFKSEE